MARRADPERDDDVAARLKAHVDPRASIASTCAARRCCAPSPRTIRRNGRWLLQLPSHHLALDHTSEDLLVEEITLILQGRRPNSRPPFRSGASWRRRGWVQTAVEERRNFSARCSATVEEPTRSVQSRGCARRRRPRWARSASHARRSLALRQLREQAKRHGVSVASAVPPAWALVLARTTRQGRRGVRHRAVRPHAGRRRCRARAGHVHQHAAVAGADGQAQRAGAVRQTHAALSGLLHRPSIPRRPVAGPALQCGLARGVPLFSSMLNYRHLAQHDDATGAEAWRGIENLAFRERSNYPSRCP